MKLLDIRMNVIELQLILEKYVSQELLPWAKRFPDEFYKQMFRLKGWEYRGKAKLYV